MASHSLAFIGFRNITSLSYISCILFLANSVSQPLKTIFFLFSGGDKEEGDDGQDLRRTESDSGLKKVFFPPKIHYLKTFLALPSEFPVCEIHPL